MAEYHERKPKPLQGVDITRVAHVLNRTGYGKAGVPTKVLAKKLRYKVAKRRVPGAVFRQVYEEDSEARQRSGRVAGSFGERAEGTSRADLGDVTRHAPRWEDLSSDEQAERVAKEYRASDWDYLYPDEKRAEIAFVRRGLAKGSLGEFVERARQKHESAGGARSQRR